MCVSFGKAEFEGTRILAAKKYHPETGQPVDVMMYDVSAKSPDNGFSLSTYSSQANLRLSRASLFFPSALNAHPEPTHPGRAISLNLPASEPLGPENFIRIPKTQKDVLKKAALELFSQGVDPSTFMRTRLAGSRGPRVFDHDDFTIASSGKATDILSVLPQIPERRRAAVNPELLRFYEEAYQGWSFAIAFWDSSQEGNARMLLACNYESTLPGYFMPAVDNQNDSGIHTGSAPLNKDVQRDHTLMWGKDDMHPETAVNITKFKSTLPEELARWLPDYIQGTDAHQFDTTKNGDFYIEPSDPRLSQTKGPWSGFLGDEGDFEQTEYNAPVLQPRIWQI